MIDNHEQLKFNIFIDYYLNQCYIKVELFLSEFSIWKNSFSIDNQCSIATQSDSFLICNKNPNVAKTSLIKWSYPLIQKLKAKLKDMYYLSFTHSHCDRIRDEFKKQKKTSNNYCYICEKIEKAEFKFYVICDSKKAYEYILEFVDNLNKIDHQQATTRNSRGEICFFR